MGQVCPQSVKFHPLNWERNLPFVCLQLLLWSLTTKEFLILGDIDTTLHYIIIHQSLKPIKTCVLDARKIFVGNEIPPKTKVSHLKSIENLSASISSICKFTGKIQNISTFCSSFVFNTNNEKIMQMLAKEDVSAVACKANMMYFYFNFCICLIKFSGWFITINNNIFHSLLLRSHTTKTISVTSVI